MLDHAAAGPVHWVGNSLGGIVALEMLGAHEGRFRQLATFGTAYRLALPGGFGGLVPLSYRVFGAALNARVTAWRTTRNAAARPIIEKLVRQFDPQVGGILVNVLARYDLIASATAVSLPILLMRGSEDRAVNAALGPTLAAMRGRPNFTLVEIEGGGHCANLDATAAWRAALLAFWEGR